MPIRAIARLIQTMLYSRRFFPYYVYNILGGIEEDGKLLVLEFVLLATGIYHTLFHDVTGSLHLTDTRTCFFNSFRNWCSLLI